MLMVVDDATKHLLYAQLVEDGESTAAILTALRAVLTTYGIPGALYPDRAGWAVYTPPPAAPPTATASPRSAAGWPALGIRPGDQPTWVGSRPAPPFSCPVVPRRGCWS